MDNQELSNLIDKKTQAHSSISVGCTWVEGKIVFKHTKKWSMFWYGICNFSGGIWAVTPLDYDRPTMITTIQVSPLEKYCEKGFVCMNTKCNLNRFNLDTYLAEFKDCGAFSLSIPKNFADTTPWFNEDKWLNFWRKLIISPEGGKLVFNEKIGYEKLGIGD
jgi:hypothetical protein